MTIVPLSIADDISSLDGRDMACHSTSWLLSMGFSIAILALYAKLWRINQVFQGQQFRRVTVTSQKVTILSVVLATVNFMLLLLWTLIDPLQWELRSVQDEPWNQYGECDSKGMAGTVFFALTLAFNGIVLVMACYQACKAKDISDECSEAKHLAIALFGWVEIVLVGIPVLFLIDRDNRDARHFLQIILITCICLSMLLIIFVPIMVHYRKSHQMQGGIVSSDMISTRKIKVSGISLPPNYTSSLSPPAQHPVKTNSTASEEQAPQQYHQSEPVFDLSGLGLSAVDEECNRSM